MTEALAALRQAVVASRPRARSLRSRSFQLTQALVLLTISLIYLAHFAAAHAAPGGDTAQRLYTIRDVVTMLSLIPAVYAALMFGLEGAVLTTLWVAVLVAPLAWFSSGTSRLWLIEPTIFLMVLVTGTILALRVEGERHARERAESLSRRITLLHELCLSLVHTGPISDLLADFVDALRAGLGVAYASISYQGEPDAEPLVVSSGDEQVASLATAASVGEGDPALIVDTCVVPLTGEHSSFGVLAVAQLHTRLTDDERQLAALASLEASLALELRQLHDRRREAITLYARRVTNAQEEERARIARDLHDGVVQLLSGLVRAIDLLEQECGPEASQLPPALNHLREIATEALIDVRRVIRDLRPATLDRLGLPAALRSLASELASRAGMEVGLQFGEPADLPREVELCIFRVVQEALSNVEKHAGASRVDIELTRSSDALQVEVRDNGAGTAAPMDTMELARGGRFGLLGMTERAALVGGTIEMTVSPGGTRLVLRVPVEPEEPDEAERCTGD